MKLPDGPNVVLLVIDSLRPDHLSCYGYSKQTSPNIDNLAHNSVVFEDAISPSAWTRPVFASILTGTYPSKNGVYSGFVGKSSSRTQYVDRFPTIMEILRPYGYRSFGVTDSFLVNLFPPEFDRFIGLNFPSAAKMMVLENRAALRKFIDLLWQRKSVLNLSSSGASFLKNMTAKTWVDGNYARGPFFMLIHHSVHWPFEPPDPFYSSFLDESLKRQVGSIRRDVYELIAQQDLSRHTEVLKALYDAQIAWVDACVADLLDHLKSLGIFENTLVVITADHGELLGEHGLLFHQFVLYEPLIKVPFIVKFPDLYNNGKRYSGLVQTVDILPTVLDYLKLEWRDVSRELQGKSLLKLVEKEDEREFTISERSDWSPRFSAKRIAELEQKYPKFDWEKYVHEIVAIRTKDYKYIWSSEGRDELYDLAHDPEETNNTISNQTEKARELRDKMESWKHSFVPAEQFVLERELEGSVKKRLRKLGYLE